MKHCPECGCYYEADYCPCCMLKNDIDRLFRAISSKEDKHVRYGIIDMPPEIRRVVGRNLKGKLL